MQFGEKRIMGLSVLKLQILRGSIARRVLLRAILFATAMAIFPFLQLLRDNEPATTVIFDVKSDCCTQNVASKSLVFPGQFLKPLSGYAFSLFPSPAPCKEESKNLTMSLFRELMDKKLLNSGAKALCVGEGSAMAVSALNELGVITASGMKLHPFSLFKRKRFVHELDLDDNSFDFVFSRALNRVSVPALFVLETERILKPGGIGAILVALPNLDPGSLIKSVTPISSFLKSSEVIHVTSVESFSMVVFKKNIDIVNPFERYMLPDECLSVKNNKPFIEHLEPLMEKKSVGTIEGGNFSYLPKFIDVSSRKRFIYIDIGAGQFMNSNITSRIFDSYPIKSQAFNVYVVDHDTSVLSSYVNKPRINFVYHPSLVGKKGTESFDEADDLFPYYDEGFDLLVWFKETVAEGDFVVLKMNAAEVELKFLHELFDSGAICLVDELFLRCPGSTEGKANKHGDCVDLFEGLRSRGVFVHQWMEE